MNDSNDDQRHLRHIYEKFRKNVVTGNVPSQYIDEDDLVDIYDYAGDNGDEYVQLMAIICAMNQCPNNEDMLQRRAYFFMQNLGLVDSAKHLMQGHRNESALWEILSLLIERPDREEVVASLERIVKTFNDFDDETIIQLVNVCSELGLLDWLKDNKERIQKRCMYADTFLYETARMMAENFDHQFAIKLLDELTGIEPFNVLYWQLLADEYIQLDDYANALNAIDYALAIDGNNSELQLMRAQILYDNNTDKDRALDFVRNMLKTDPNNVDAATTLCVMLSFSGKNGEAAKLIRPYVKKHPGNRSVIANALTAGDSELNAEALSLYMKTDKSLADDDVNAWAKEQEQLGRFSTAADILLAWLNQNGSITEWSLLLSSLYKSNRYSDIELLHEKYIIKSDKKERIAYTVSDLLLIAFSFARTGSFSACKDICGFIANVDFHDFADNRQRIEIIGVKAVALQLSDYLAGSKVADKIDDMDPFRTVPNSMAPLA